MGRSLSQHSHSKRVSSGRHGRHQHRSRRRTVRWAIEGTRYSRRRITGLCSHSRSYRHPHRKQRYHRLQQRQSWRRAAPLLRCHPTRKTAGRSLMLCCGSSWAEHRHPRQQEHHQPRQESRLGLVWATTASHRYWRRRHRRPSQPRRQPHLFEQPRRQGRHNRSLLRGTSRQRPAGRRVHQLFGRDRKSNSCRRCRRRMQAILTGRYRNQRKCCRRW